MELEIMDEVHAGTTRLEAGNLSAMAAGLEEKVVSLEQRIERCEAEAGGALQVEVERMVATVEAASQSDVEALEARLAAAELHIEALQAGMQAAAQGSATAGRKTVGAATTSLLAKHGVGEGGPVESAAVDAALSSLPVEQRIAVKSQLMRAGLLG